MDNVVNINSLIARFALQSNLSEDAAANFVSNFFNVIEQGLADGQEVDIKDFGVFYNTDGQVAFRPHEAFAELVNEPFSIFSPMPLTADMDLSVLEIEEDTDTLHSLTPEASVEVTTDFVEVKGPTPPPFNPETFCRLITEFEEEQPPILSITETEDNSLNEASDEIPSELNSEDSEEYKEEYYEEPQPRKISIMWLWVWIVVALLIGILAGICAGYVGHAKIANLF